MTIQHVPTKPIGCYLDHTYCGSPHCQNECGRKMSDSIKKEVEKDEYARVAFSYFCGESK
jgi:hypothetical protein